MRKSINDLYFTSHSKFDCVLDEIEYDVLQSNLISTDSFGDFFSANNLNLILLERGLLFDHSNYILDRLFNADIRVIQLEFILLQQDVVI